MAVSTSASSYDDLVNSISRLSISAEPMAERGNAQRYSDSSSTSSASSPPLSTGIHPTDLSSLPEVSNGPPDKRWYTVTVGHYPGIFDSWEQTSSYVNGYPNNCHKKYSSKEKALSAYKSAWDRGQVQGKVYYPGARVAP